MKIKRMAGFDVVKEDYFKKSYISYLETYGIRAWTLEII